MDKIILFIVIGVVLLGVGFWAWQSGIFGPENITPTPVVDGIILFYGDGCPHCKNVEDFIQANKIEDKIKVTRLEVPFGTKTSPVLLSNADLLLQKAKECKVDTSSGISIPFLYDGKGKCIIGDEPVINFFKNEAGIK